MDSPRKPDRVLAGVPRKPEHGAPAHVAAVFAPRLNEGAEQEAFERSGADAFVASPFLRVIGDDGARRLLVGQVRVAVTARGTGRGDRRAPVLLGGVRRLASGAGTGQ